MFHRAIIRRLAVIAAVLLVALPSRALFAQTGTISGKVTDAATAQPIADARVVIAGTAFEAQTNKDGDFRLTNVKPGRTGVSVFRLGYKASRDSVMVLAGQTATLNIKMTQSVINLSEVVVTGTAGNQERKAQAALVASVKAADIIKDAPITSVANLLQSRVPGVALSAQSGTAGTATTIRIRGASSINLSNQPLLFIDGVRINEGQIGSGQSGQAFDRMNDLNPEEIESIEVVKGPAAATLYGADASAGVIQIITKKGRAGSNSFEQTLRVEGGTSELANYTPPDNYALCTAATVAATSTNPLCRGKTIGDLVSDNPLRRVGAFRTGEDRGVNYGARGGGQNYGFNLSYGSQNTSGTLPNNRYNRYNVRTNVNYIANSKLNVDVGLGLTQSSIDLPDNDNNIFGWLGGALLGSPATRNDSPTGALTQDGWFSNRHYNAINSIQRRLLTKRVTTSVTANYTPTAWFTNRFTGGMDYANDDQRSFFPKNDSLWYGGLTDGGSNASTSRSAERYTFDYLGNAKKGWGADWETNLSFGLQVISSRNTLLTATGIGFVTNSNNSVGSAATTTGGGGFTEQRQFGYLSQLQIGNKNRRFLQVGVRVDKNSSFGVRAPSFVLPKVGGSWAISEEEFFNPLAGLINTLRLRAAYGTTGRSPNPGDALTTLVAAPFNIVGSTSPGAIPGNPGNGNLKPERGTEFEAGLDAGFFDNRVSAELTYFRKATKDLIIAKPQPPSLGFASFPLANIGSVENSGLELALNISALNKANVRWDIRAGANTLHNELTSLGSGADLVLPFPLGGVGRTIVGQQLGVPVSKRIESINTTTNVVTVSDTLAPMGNLFPTFEWNLTNTVTLFKSIRLSALLDAKRDFIVSNNTAFFRETQLVRSNLRLDPTALSATERLRRFGNPTSGQPAFVTNKGNPATVNDVRDAYLERGDFVRLREVSATYTLPSSLARRMRGVVDGASVTFAMQNVKLWTDYSGPDPEVNSQTGAFSREDFLTLPNPRKTVLRFNFTF
ncbi:SusC/RagA family TonB-linked outer membrane protein [Gemmatimonas sp.]|uniref:SusC/RagA family TonB-linked outer membrane protein n=1 Tax=Gemmatimonas sp. TaxID=1962908 RepID=UPI00286BB46C|nr:SusC/RagA family TonB-linked outer membrane protein [Gemmatimonas sp.]